MEISRSRQLTLAGAALAFAGALGVAALSDVSAAGALGISTASTAVELFLLSLALGGAWGTRLRPAEALGWAPGHLSGGTVALLALATLGASHALDGVLSLLDLRGRSALGELSEALVNIRGRELTAALLGLGLLPAVVEELLCRGLIQRSLLRRAGPALAIAGSSLLFALLHGEAIHAALAFPLGVHLGIVAWWGGSTRPAVLCHAANNLGAVVLGVAAFDPPGSPWLHVALGLSLAAASWAAALAARRRSGRGSALQPTPGMDDR